MTPVQRRSELCSPPKARCAWGSHALLPHRPPAAVNAAKSSPFAAMREPVIDGSRTHRRPGTSFSCFVRRQAMQVSRPSVFGSRQSDVGLCARKGPPRSLRTSAIRQALSCSCNVRAGRGINLTNGQSPAPPKLTGTGLPQCVTSQSTAEPLRLSRQIVPNVNVALSQPCNKCCRTRAPLSNVTRPLAGALIGAYDVHLRVLG